MKTTHKSSECLCCFCQRQSRLREKRCLFFRGVEVFCSSATRADNATQVLCAGLGSSHPAHLSYTSSHETELVVPKGCQVSDPWRKSMKLKFASKHTLQVSFAMPLSPLAAKRSQQRAWWSAVAHASLQTNASLRSFVAHATETFCRFCQTAIQDWRNTMAISRALAVPLRFLRAQT